MADAGVDIAALGGMEPGGVRFLFRTFKRILALNTQALERMAQMDRALGGGYVFDKAFLDKSVRDICRLTHLVAYHLNGMAGETLTPLYDATLAVRDALEDILAGGMGPLAHRRALPFSELGWELEPLAGLCAAGLAVLGRRLSLPAPDGFAVTVTGMAALAGDDPREVGNASDDIVREAGTLFARLGGARPLLFTFVAAGERGTGRVLAEATCGGADIAADVAAETARMARGRLCAEALAGGVAVCVRPNVSGVARGTIQTLAHDPSLPPAMLVVAGPPENWAGLAAGDESPVSDRYWLSRTAPHQPLRTRLGRKDLNAPLPGGGPLSPSRGRMLRGSAWLTPEQSAELAEIGLAAERALDGPCLLSWTLAEAGGFVITGLAPARAAFPELSADAPDADAAGGDPCDAVDACPDPADALLRGGQVACAGVGAGPIARIGESTLPESVPLGSVGVARAAAPSLSRIVPRLGALLTEVGTAASHLATVARESRVPAVFGLPGATALPAGTMVTVDAEQGVVYRGVAEGLLRQAAMQRAREGAEPEVLVLRRLLRHIRPLNLVDPAAENFRAGNCRTCHDIIHFAHERAVELLVEMDPLKKGGLGAPRRLAEDSPLELRVVDVGGGLTDGPAKTPGASGDVCLADIASEPLRAFIEGLLLPEARREGPANVGLGDILSGMGRSGRALSTPASGAGLNLALAGRDYANITLRLGYHFSVVDAVVGEKPEQNFLYFRFAGGFAGDDRRARRAGLILRVLERLGFRAMRKGDLVVGKRRMLEAEDALTGMRLLGALSAYTRQLDVELADDADAERFARGFIEALHLPENFVDGGDE